VRAGGSHGLRVGHHSTLQKTLHKCGRQLLAPSGSERNTRTYQAECGADEQLGLQLRRQPAKLLLRELERVPDCAECSGWAAR
jgi:hypothetical protein